MTYLARSAKRNRVYVRKFDHDEARARHAAGETTAALAAEYGVSWAAVGRVVDAATAARMAATHRAIFQGVCEECRRPCLSAQHAAKRLRDGSDGRELCRACRDKARRIHVGLTDGGRVVEVRCLGCARWFDPDYFSRGSRYRDLRDGGFAEYCRDCQAAQKRAYREKHRQPCSHGCGTMVNTDDRRASGKPLECRPCSIARIWRERKAAA